MAHLWSCHCAVCITQMVLRLHNKMGRPPGEAEQVLAQLDLDGDGRISFGEFKALMLGKDALACQVGDAAQFGVAAAQLVLVLVVLHQCVAAFASC